MAICAAIWSASPRKRSRLSIASNTARGLRYGDVASEVVSLPDLEMVDRPNPTWLKRFSNKNNR